MGIAGLAKFSTVDFPGRLAAVVFTAGCNYDCFYCHNRQLIPFSGQEELPLAEVWAFLQKRKGLLDGVVVSGGEATFWQGLSEFLARCKANGFATKLDTNGSRPEVVRRLLAEGLLDYVAVDYKAPFDRYPAVCGLGVDPEKVKETFALLLAQDKVSFEARTTVFPTLSEQELVRMAQEAPVFPRYVLNGYRKPELFCEKDREQIEQKPYSRQELERFVRLLLPYQPNCALGTV